QEFLGTTAAEIAAEKAGIIRHGRPVIWGGVDAASRDADAVIRQAAVAAEAPLYALGEHFMLTPMHLEVALPGHQAFTVALPPGLREKPQFLKCNFAMAVAAFYAFRRDAAATRNAVQALADGRVPTPPCHRARFQHIVAAPKGLE